MRSVIALLTVLLSVPLSTLEAQQSPPVQPGARVRVSQCRTQTVKGEAPKETCEWRTGTLSSLTPDAVALWVIDRPTELVVPLDSVTRLDVYRRRSGVAWGAGIGLVVGVAGGLIFAQQLAAGTGDLSDEEEAEYRTKGAFVGGALGALLGAGIGLSIRTEGWKEVSLNRLRVTRVATLDGRLGLAVSVRF